MNSIDETNGGEEGGEGAYEELLGWSGTNSTGTRDLFQDFFNLRIDIQDQLGTEENESQPEPAELKKAKSERRTEENENDDDKWEECFEDARSEVSQSHETSDANKNNQRKTFDKGIPLDPEATWDFSFQALKPGFKSKCFWVEGAFYQKLTGECLHEMHHVTCQCEEKKKIPTCRLCNMVFCSSQCFKKMRKQIQNINKDEELVPKEEIPSSKINGLKSVEHLKKDESLDASSSSVPEFAETKEPPRARKEISTIPKNDEVPPIISYGPLTDPRKPKNHQVNRQRRGKTIFNSQKTLDLPLVPPSTTVINPNIVVPPPLNLWPSQVRRNLATPATSFQSSQKGITPQKFVNFTPVLPHSMHQPLTKPVTAFAGSSPHVVSNGAGLLPFPNNHRNIQPENLNGSMHYENQDPHEKYYTPNSSPNAGETGNARKYESPVKILRNPGPRN